MGLAQADAAVDEERVVDAGRLLGDGAARGVGELVAPADDEILERELRLEVRAVRARRRRRAGRIGDLVLPGGRRVLERRSGSPRRR